jgi:hypothetical protein
LEDELNLFTETPPLDVSSEQSGLSYQAGAIRVIASQAAIWAAQRKFSGHMREHYGYHVDTKLWAPDIPQDAWIEREILLKRDEAKDVAQKSWAVLASSIDQELDPATVLGWFFDHPDFFENCYQTAIRLNPSFVVTEEEIEAQTADDADPEVSKKKASSTGKTA